MNCHLPGWLCVAGRRAPPIAATLERRFAPLRTTMDEDQMARVRQEGALFPRTELLDALALQSSAAPHEAV